MVQNRRKVGLDSTVKTISAIAPIPACQSADKIYFLGWVLLLEGWIGW